MQSNGAKMGLEYNTIITVWLMLLSMYEVTGSEMNLWGVENAIAGGDVLCGMDKRRGRQGRAELIFHERLYSFTDSLLFDEEEMEPTEENGPKQEVELCINLDDEVNNNPGAVIHAKKTGTTIVGCVADNGRTAVIAADTRATSGAVVADKRCEKVHRLAENVWCCGAGTSADIDALVTQVRYSFLLRGRLQASIGNHHRTPYDELPIARIPAICRFLRDNLYYNNGNLQANLVLAGFEPSTQTAVLAAVHPHGSIDMDLPYTALGSGGLAAMSVLESRYTPEIDTVEAIQLVKDAVKAGIANDLGSGSAVDLAVIRRDGTHYTRSVIQEQLLPCSDEHLLAKQRVHDRNTAPPRETQMFGVNGFGSLPYVIRSTKVLVRNERDVERLKREWLEDILDFKDQ